MAYRKKYKRKAYQRKKYKPKYKSASSFSKNIGARQGGLPDNVFLKMKYADQLTLTSTAGSIGSQQYAINDIFDPDYTNGGTNHQPMLRDQLAAIYTQYQVKGCSIKISCIGVTTAIPGLLTLSGRDVADLPATNLREALEQNNVSSRVVAGYEGMNKVVFDKYFSIKRLRGLKALVNDGVTDIGYSPDNRVFANINWQSLNAASTTACNLLVQMKFYVSLRNKALVAQS